MKKYSAIFLGLVWILGLTACGTKNETEQSIPVSLTPPAMIVIITREICPSIEVQAGMEMMWMHGDKGTLPITVEELDDNGNVLTIGKSEINSDNLFSVWFEHAGTYHLYCSENRDVYATITVK